MDKIAFYEEAILGEVFEKTAERAWKKHIGELSPSSRNTLVREGVLNYKREFDGLKTGTKNIAKETGAKIIKNPVGHFFAARSIGKANTAAGDAIKRNPQGMTIYGEKKGQPRDIIMFKHKDHAKDFDKMSHKTTGVKPFDEENLNKFERAYVNAIMERHEVDESRYARKKGNTVLPISKKRKQHYATHASPDVIFNESEHVSFAPQRVRKAFSNVRYLTGEAKDINNNTPITYGNSGLIDKNIRARLRNVMTQKNLLKENELAKLQRKRIINLPEKM